MIQIRSCAGFGELEACVQLQIETWGIEPSEVIPRKTFLLAQKIGGQVIGAFENSGTSPAQSLVGFAMSLPGIKTTANGPQPYLHSHMLAVRPAYRNRGLGAQLKWEQRSEALARGIRHMEWTFDPLELKNAFLNLHKLGAVVRSYLSDFYGVSSSRLQGGLPTGVGCNAR
jgi:predicted GNAT superfamily acetyltransferase